MFNSYLVIYLIIAIVISSFINIYAWGHRETRGSKAFVATCSSAILWMLSDVIGRTSETYNGQWFGEIVRYFGISVLPVALYVFINQYCGKEITPRKIKWLLAIPALSWLLVLTNPYHNLFFKSVTLGVDSPMKGEYGIYFWLIHLPYSYSLLLLGFLKTFMEFSRASRDYRQQIFYLLLAFPIPFIFNVIGVFKLIPNFYYTPLSFPIFFSIMGFSIFRHQFLGSNPIGYEAVFKTIRDGVLILDRFDVIRDINPAAAKGLNKKPTEVIGTFVREAFGAWESAVTLYDKKPLELGEIEVTLFGSTRYLAIDSTPFATINGIYEGRIITIRDITDRHQHQLSLEALAFHDPLTRLANRRKFQEEVERAIVNSIENKQPFALLYFDLNRFKAVNDKLGHEVGDELLKYVAARVASILRKPDILARIGGDEFALLLHNCDENGVDLVVERLLDNVRRPFKVGENTLVADLSIGAAYYPQNGKNLTELLRHADSAMYRAKQNGGGLHLPSIKLDTTSNLEM